MEILMIGGIVFVLLGFFVGYKKDKEDDFALGGLIIGCIIGLLLFLFGLAGCFCDEIEDKQFAKENYQITIYTKNNEILTQYENIKNITYYQKDGSLSFVGKDNIIYTVYPDEKE